MSNPFVRLISSYRTRTGSAFVHEQLLASINQAKRDGLTIDQDSLYVRTSVDDLVDEIVSGHFEFQVVILTGDAGDGKTCVAERVSWAGAQKKLSLPVEEIEIKGETWKIVKDASENQIDIAEAIHAAVAGQNRLLIAANEGRLRAESLSLGTLWNSVLGPSLDDGLDDESLQLLDTNMQHHKVLVVNFRMRSEVAALATGLLGNWTAREYWEGAACGTCPKSGVCPILSNATALREIENRTGLVRALSWLEISGQRLPVRRLQGILAYVLTGGTTCESVLGAAANEEAALQSHRYWNGLFSRKDAEPAAAPLSYINAELAAIPSRDDILLAELRPGGDIHSARNRANLEAHESEWRTAVDLTEEGQHAELLREVTRSMNYLCDAVDNAEELAKKIRDPSSLTDRGFARVYIGFPNQTIFGMRRLPRVAKRAGRYLGTRADRLELFVRDQPTISLRLSTVLIMRLVAMRTRRLSPASLGQHLSDVQKFLRKIIQFQESVQPGHIQVLIGDAQGNQYSVKGANKKLQLNQVF
jgi:hypothetical protein